MKESVVLVCIFNNIINNFYKSIILKNFFSSKINPCELLYDGYDKHEYLLIQGPNEFLPYE